MIRLKNDEDKVFFIAATLYSRHWEMESLEIHIKKVLLKFWKTIMCSHGILKDMYADPLRWVR